MRSNRISGIKATSKCIAISHQFQFWLPQSRSLIFWWGSPGTYTNRVWQASENGGNFFIEHFWSLNNLHTTFKTYRVSLTLILPITLLCNKRSNCKNTSPTLYKNLQKINLLNNNETSSIQGETENRIHCTISIIYSLPSHCLVDTTLLCVSVGIIVVNKRWHFFYKSRLGDGIDQFEKEYT